MAARSWIAHVPGLLRRAIASLGLLIGVIVATPAWADPKDDARRHFLEGLEAAERGDYRAAVEAFLAAQDAFPHPSTVYNIARAYDDLGEPAEALAWYRRFAAEVPDRAGEVQPAITRLQAALAPVAPATVAPAPAAPAPIPAPSGDQVEQLEALAAEVRALIAALKGASPEGGAASPPEPADVPPEDPTEPAAPAPGEALEPPSGAATPGQGFVEDPYQREIVTAARVGQDPLDSPSTVTVLTADDIRLSGATNLPDLLRRVPGVDVMSLASSSPNVGIRGFNSELSNKVLWLVDGRQVYWDFLATPLPLNQSVSLDEIERVEVIRGPASAIYGANAVTGVINIITREPGDGARARLSLSGGHPGFIQATGLTSGRAGPLSYRMSAGYDQDGRWAKPIGEDRVGGDSPLTPFFQDQDLGARKVRATARLDATFARKGFASISGGYTQGRMEFYNLGALGDYGIDGRTHWLRGDLAWGDVRLFAFWNQETGRVGPWAQSAGAPQDLDADLRNDVVQVEVEGTPTFQTGEVRHQLALGAGYRYKDSRFDYLEGGFDRPWVEHHFYGFVQEQLRWRWLGVVASLRLDRHPLLSIAKTISPRGALVFRVQPTTSVRVGGGTAYRAMNAVESYMGFNLGTQAPGFFVRDYGGETAPGAPGLDPERVVNVEVGVHDESSAWHRADVAVYYNRVSDLIGLAPVSPTLTPFDPEANGFQAGTTGWTNYTDLVYHAIGGELDLTVFPVDGLDVFGNLSVERILEQGPAGTVVDGSTSLVRMNLGAMYRAPFRTDLAVMGHYLSPQAWRLRELDASGASVVDTQGIDGRFVLSARVAVRPIPDHHLELAVTLWNPLGFAESTAFREHPKGQPVGGRLFGTVSLELP